MWGYLPRSCNIFNDCQKKGKEGRSLLKTRKPQEGSQRKKERRSFSDFGGLRGTKWGTNKPERPLQARRRVTVSKCNKKLGFRKALL